MSEPTRPSPNPQPHSPSTQYDAALRQQLSLSSGDQPRSGSGSAPKPTPDSHGNPGKPRPSSLGRRAGPLLPIMSALLLGTTFYIYSTTTVSAAKENARRAREADGGHISWRREGMRRHGQLEGYKERGLWEEFWGVKDGGGGAGGAEKGREDWNEIEEGIRRAREGRRRSEGEGGSGE